MLSTEARTLAGTLYTLVTSSDRSLRSVGDSMDRAPSTVSQWINGQRMPSLEDLTVLLDVLGADEHTRTDLFRLHYNASGHPQPDYATVAHHIVEHTKLAAHEVADVLDALARYVHVTEGMSGTNLDSADLRAIAAQCTY